MSEPYRFSETILRGLKTADLLLGALFKGSTYESALSLVLISGSIYNGWLIIQVIFYSSTDSVKITALVTTVWAILFLRSLIWIAFYKNLQNIPKIMVQKSMLAGAIPAIVELVAEYPDDYREGNFILFAGCIAGGAFLIGNIKDFIQSYEQRMSAQI